MCLQSSRYLSLTVALAIFSHFPLSAAEISIQQATLMALQQDSLLQGVKLQRQSYQAKSQAADSLPDPVVTVGMLNLPTDGFAFNQEPMTQLKVGISQVFSQGDSRDIEQEKWLQMTYKQDHLIAQRMAMTTSNVAQLYLDVLLVKRKAEIVEQHKVLFEQLADIVQASYSSAQGNTQQQDVVRAQLELSRIEDRLLQLQIEYELSKAKLAQWLFDDHGLNIDFDVTNQLPQYSVASISAGKWQKLSDLSVQTHSVYQTLAQHPAIAAIEKQIKTEQADIKLAEQKYQPKWGVNASYAYRDNDPLGQSRADFFSVGLSVQVPLFSKNRNDQDTQAARFKAESVKTEKRLMLREMLAEVLKLTGKQTGLIARSALYHQTILPQMAEQVEASLTAYTNSNGVFTDVMRDRITELNGKIDLLKIEIEQQKVYVQMAYFFTGNVLQEPAQ